MSVAAAIRRLVAGDRLDAASMTAAFEEIVAGTASDAQIAAFAIALRMRGESPEEIAAAATVMRTRATRVRFDGPDYVDTCGTGGDGAGTFNVSTTAAFVVAACGLPVAKHGNVSVSSRSGSADVLKELGVDVSAPLATVEKALATTGIAFLYAPLYHGALKHAANARKQIGVRTFFNLLGPLCNPAGAPFQVIGIYDGRLLETVAHALHALGTRGALVVHGEDGLDEISLTTGTRIAYVDEHGVRIERFHPKDAGLETCRASDLAGGTPQENAQITRDVLAGETSPRRDMTVLNAAGALLAAKRAASWTDAVARANDAIESGAALKKLFALVEACRA